MLHEPARHDAARVGAAVCRDGLREACGDALEHLVSRALGQAGDGEALAGLDGDAAGAVRVELDARLLRAVVLRVGKHDGILVACLAAHRLLDGVGVAAREGAPARVLQSHHEGEVPVGRGLGAARAGQDALFDGKLARAHGVLRGLDLHGGAVIDGHLRAVVHDLARGGAQHVGRHTHLEAHRASGVRGGARHGPGHVGAAVLGVGAGLDGGALALGAAHEPRAAIHVLGAGRDVVGHDDLGGLGGARGVHGGVRPADGVGQHIAHLHRLAVDRDLGRGGARVAHVLGGCGGLVGVGERARQGMRVAHAARVDVVLGVQRVVQLGVVGVAHAVDVGPVAALAQVGAVVGHHLAADNGVHRHGGAVSHPDSQVGVVPAALAHHDLHDPLGLGEREVGVGGGARLSYDVGVVADAVEGNVAEARIAHAGTVDRAVGPLDSLGDGAVLGDGHGVEHVAVVIEGHRLGAALAREGVARVRGELEGVGLVVEPVAPGEDLAGAEEAAAHHGVGPVGVLEADGGGVGLVGRGDGARLLKLAVARPALRQVYLLHLEDGTRGQALDGGVVEAAQRARQRERGHAVLVKHEGAAVPAPVVPLELAAHGVARLVLQRYLEREVTGLGTDAVHRRRGELHDVEHAGLRQGDFNRVGGDGRVAAHLDGGGVGHLVERERLVVHAHAVRDGLAPARRGAGEGPHERGGAVLVCRGGEVLVGVARGHEREAARQHVGQHHVGGLVLVVADDHSEGEGVAHLDAGARVGGHGLLGHGVLDDVGALSAVAHGDASLVGEALRPRRNGGVVVHDDLEAQLAARALGHGVGLARPDDPGDGARRLVEAHAGRVAPAGLERVGHEVNSCGQAVGDRHLVAGKRPALVVGRVVHPAHTVGEHVAHAHELAVGVLDEGAVARGHVHGLCLLARPGVGEGAQACDAGVLRGHAQAAVLRLRDGDDIAVGVCVVADERVAALVGGVGDLLEDAHLVAAGRVEVDLLERDLRRDAVLARRPVGGAVGVGELAGRLVGGAHRALLVDVDGAALKAVAVLRGAVERRHLGIELEGALLEALVALAGQDLLGGGGVLGLVGVHVVHLHRLRRGRGDGSHGVVGAVGREARLLVLAGDVVRALGKAVHHDLLPGPHGDGAVLGIGDVVRDGAARHGLGAVGATGVLLEHLVGIAARKRRDVRGAHALDLGRLGREEVEGEGELAGLKLRLGLVAHTLGVEVELLGHGQVARTRVVGHADVLGGGAHRVDERHGGAVHQVGRGAGLKGLALDVLEGGLVHAHPEGHGALLVDGALTQLPGNGAGGLVEGHRLRHALAGLERVGIERHTCGQRVGHGDGRTRGGARGVDGVVVPLDGVGQLLAHAHIGPGRVLAGGLHRLGVLVGVGHGVDVGEVRLAVSHKRVVQVLGAGAVGQAAHRGARNLKLVGLRVVAHHDRHAVARAAVVEVVVGAGQLLANHVVVRPGLVVAATREGEVGLTNRVAGGADIRLGESHRVDGAARGGNRAVGAAHGGVELGRERLIVLPGAPDKDLAHLEAVLHLGGLGVVGVGDAGRLDAVRHDGARLAGVARGEAAQLRRRRRRRSLDDLVAGALGQTRDAHGVARLEREGRRALREGEAAALDGRAGHGAGEAVGARQGRAARVGERDGEVEPCVGDVRGTHGAAGDHGLAQLKRAVAHDERGDVGADLRVVGNLHRGGVRHDAVGGAAGVGLGSYVHLEAHLARLASRHVLERPHHSGGVVVERAALRCASLHIGGAGRHGVTHHDGGRAALGILVGDGVQDVLAHLHGACGLAGGGVHHLGLLHRRVVHRGTGVGGAAGDLHRGGVLDLAHAVCLGKLVDPVVHLGREGEAARGKRGPGGQGDAHLRAALRVGGDAGVDAGGQAAHTHVREALREHVGHRDVGAGGVALAVHGVVDPGERVGERVAHADLLAVGIENLNRVARRAGLGAHLLGRVVGVGERDAAAALVIGDLGVEHAGRLVGDPDRDVACHGVDPGGDARGQVGRVLVHLQAHGVGLMGAVVAHKTRRQHLVERQRAGLDALLKRVVGSRAAVGLKAVAHREADLREVDARGLPRLGGEVVARGIEHDRLLVSRVAVHEGELEAELAVGHVAAGQRLGRVDARGAALKVALGLEGVLERRRGTADNVGPRRVDEGLHVADLLAGGAVVRHPGGDLHGALAVGHGAHRDDVVAGVVGVPGRAARLLADAVGEGLAVVVLGEGGRQGRGVGGVGAPLGGRVPQAAGVRQLVGRSLGGCCGHVAVGVKGVLGLHVEDELAGLEGLARKILGDDDAGVALGRAVRVHEDGALQRKRVARLVLRGKGEVGAELRLVPRARGHEVAVTVVAHRHAEHGLVGDVGPLATRARDLADREVERLALGGHAVEGDVAESHRLAVPGRLDGAARGHELLAVARRGDGVRGDAAVGDGLGGGIVSRGEPEGEGVGRAGHAGDALHRNRRDRRGGHVVLVGKVELGDARGGLRRAARVHRGFGAVGVRHRGGGRQHALAVVGDGDGHGVDRAVVGPTGGVAGNVLGHSERVRLARVGLVEGHGTAKEARHAEHGVARLVGGRVTRQRERLVGAVERDAELLGGLPSGSHGLAVELGVCRGDVEAEGAAGAAALARDRLAYVHAALGSVVQTCVVVVLEGDFGLRGGIDRAGVGELRGHGDGVGAVGLEGRDRFCGEHARPVVIGPQARLVGELLDARALHDGGHAVQLALVGGQGVHAHEDVGAARVARVVARAVLGRKAGGGVGLGVCGDVLADAEQQGLAQAVLGEGAVIGSPGGILAVVHRTALQVLLGAGGEGLAAVDGTVEGAEIVAVVGERLHGERELIGKRRAAGDGLGHVDARVAATCLIRVGEGGALGIRLRAVRVGHSGLELAVVVGVGHRDDHRPVRVVVGEARGGIMRGGLGDVEGVGALLLEADALAHDLLEPNLAGVLLLDVAVEVGVVLHPVVHIHGAARDGSGGGVAAQPADVAGRDGGPRGLVGGAQREVERLALGELVPAAAHEVLVRLDVRDGRRGVIGVGEGRHGRLAVAVHNLRHAPVGVDAVVGAAHVDACAVGVALDHEVVHGGVIGHAGALACVLHNLVHVGAAQARLAQVVGCCIGHRVERHLARVPVAHGVAHGEAGGLFGVAVAYALHGAGHRNARVGVERGEVGCAVEAPPLGRACVVERVV